MLTLLLTIGFFVFLIGIVVKLIAFGIKAAWSVGTFVLKVALWPLVLIGLVIGGLLSIAWPLLIIIGIYSIIKTAKVV